jgi:hypothetical protein
MRIRQYFAVAVGLLTAVLSSPAGTPKPAYQALPPVTQNNLSIFPVVATVAHDTSRFTTLDEGLRSGQVIVTEAGSPGMLRGPTPARRGAEVNRLVLINNSDRALLLLAGEIVTGGKQDRVVGKDRIVPPKSDPVDLSVFCVEPGRWVETSDKFGALSSQMAQPSVRSGAMADQNQARVWDEVRKSQAAVGGIVAAAPAASETTSYARVMRNAQVAKEVDSVAQPIAESYDRIIRELRDRKAVGVVVAVNGRVIWADLFASTALLEKYWPKLVRSYAAEAVIARTDGFYPKPTQADAQQFLNDISGVREVAQTEPGVYREAEIQGRNYKVFELTSLLPGSNDMVHLAKMVTRAPQPMESRPSRPEPTGIVRPHVQW